ncbi:MAG: hypothetical protein DHS80DRAFT_23387 [Piptocephalis tieghemiana]|nr:MAG: hypothetical protein DHS80DRAFT_23387 [Piptocephalis tieghemiana]
MHYLDIIFIGTIASLLSCSATPMYAVKPVEFHPPAAVSVNPSSKLINDMPPPSYKATVDTDNVHNSPYRSDPGLVIDTKKSNWYIETPEGSPVDSISESPFRTTFSHEPPSGNASPGDRSSFDEISSPPSPPLSRADMITSKESFHSNTRSEAYILNVAFPRLASQRLIPSEDHPMPMSLKEGNDLVSQIMKSADHRFNMYFVKQDKSVIPYYEDKKGSMKAFDDKQIDLIVVREPGIDYVIQTFRDKKDIPKSMGIWRLLDSSVDMFLKRNSIPPAPKNNIASKITYSPLGMKIKQFYSSPKPSPKATLQGAVKKLQSMKKVVDALQTPN